MKKFVFFVIYLFFPAVIPADSPELNRRHRSPDALYEYYGDTPLDIIWDNTTPVPIVMPFPTYTTTSSPCRSLSTSSLYRSDLVPCPKSYPTMCIFKEYFCDNDPDCPNGEDEDNCPANRGCDATTHRSCNPELAQSQCVAIAQWCDGDRDCMLGEDEANCTLPQTLDVSFNISDISADMEVTLSPQRKSVNKGYNFTLTCTVTGQGFLHAEWLFTEHNMVISKDDDVYLSPYIVSMSLKGTIRRNPIPVHLMTYNLTVTNATFDAAGVYACRVYQDYESTKKVITKYANVFMPGAPIHSHRRSDYSNYGYYFGSEKMHRPRYNGYCCKMLNVTDQCYTPLCQGDDMASWKLPAVGKCMSQVPAAMICLSGGRNSVPCCVRNGVSETCQQLCDKLQPSGSGLSELVTKVMKLSMHCFTEWEKVISCYNETNAFHVDYPIGVTAQTINSTAIIVSWIAPVTAQRQYRYTVFKAELGSFQEKGQVYYEMLGNAGYTSLKSTDLTAFTATGLRPAHQYAFYVVSRSPTGVVSEKSIIVEANTMPEFSRTTGADDVDIQACCKEHNVDEQCASAFCTLNHTAEDLQRVVDKGIDCHKDVRKMFSCLAGRYDHTPCCALRHVPLKCQSFCIGHLNSSMVSHWNPLTSTELLCLAHIGSIASCFVENRGVLPNPPQSASVFWSYTPGRYGRAGSLKATLTWQPPKPLQHITGQTVSDRIKIQRFGITKSSPGSQSVGSYFVSSSTTRYTFFYGINYNRIYIFRIAAENDYGRSLEVAVSLRTPDSASAAAGGSENIAIKSAMSTCCSELGLPRNCRRKCTPSTLRNSNRFDPHGCVHRYWRHYAYCGSLQADATPCCKRKNVHSACLPICDMSSNSTDFDDFVSTTAENKMCKVFSDKIFSCVKELWNSNSIGRIFRPDPPTNLRIGYVGERLIALNWQAPRTGNAFVDYAITLQADGAGSKIEVQIPANFTKINIEHLQYNTTYWVRMFSVTHQGVRSLPSEGIEVKIPPHDITYILPPYWAKLNVDLMDLCCLDTSPNCRPLCINITTAHASADMSTRCAADLSIITRCNVLSLQNLAQNMGRSADDADITQCCKNNDVDDFNSCCAVPKNISQVSMHSGNCDSPKTLKSIGKCIWQGVASLGPSHIRLLTAIDITTTSARLTWQKPLYNPDKVTTYTVNCSIWAVTDSNATSHYIDTYIFDYLLYDDEVQQEKLEKIDERTLTKPSNSTLFNLVDLPPSSTIRCSVGATGFETKDDLTVEFSTLAEQYFVTVDVENEFTLQPGDTAVFTCNCQGFVYSSIKWYYAKFGYQNESDLIALDSNLKINSTIYKKLNIKDSDAGMYTCEVFSKYADRAFRGSAALLVHSQPTAVIAKHGEVHCDENCVSSTNCSFSGFPSTVSWERLVITPNGTQVGFKHTGQYFARSGRLTVAYIPSYSLDWQTSSRITLRATASNFVGSSTCEIPIVRKTEIRPGWRHTPNLCQLIDKNDCCTIIDVPCSSLCTLAFSCANSVPGACLSGFQKCAKSNEPSLKPPDLNGRFHLSFKLVPNWKNTAKETQMKFSWLPGKQPSYFLKEVNYIMVIESKNDPNHRQVVAAVDGGNYPLRVPNTNYTVTLFAENEIGQRSVKNAVETVKSLLPTQPTLPLISASRPENSRYPIIQVVWSWNNCHPCRSATIFYRALVTSNDSDVTAFHGFTTYEPIVHMPDDYPEKPYIFLVCVGDVRSCIYSEPVYLPAFSAVAKARRLSWSPSDDSSSAIIGLSITVALAIIFIIVLLTYQFGRRAATAISSRLSTRFIMYQRAPRIESDSGAIIFNDFNAEDNNNLESL